MTQISKSEMIEPDDLDTIQTIREISHACRKFDSVVGDLLISLLVGKPATITVDFCEMTCRYCGWRLLTWVL